MASSGPCPMYDEWKCMKLNALWEVLGLYFVIIITFFFPLMHCLHGLPQAKFPLVFWIKYFILSYSSKVSEGPRVDFDSFVPI